MALHLPSELSVALITEDPSLRDLSEIMVATDFYFERQPYYGTLLGLTDAVGKVRVTQDEILERFRESQLGGVMDYNTPLERCDERATVRIPGGGDFRLSQILAPGSAMISDWAQDLWARARNVDLAPATAMLVLDTPRKQVAITVPIQRGISGHGFWRRLTST
jgi:hypothetical protein